jgi:hypothetical protein
MVLLMDKFSGNQLNLQLRIHTGLYQKIKEQWLKTGPKSQMALQVGVMVQKQAGKQVGKK